MMRRAILFLLMLMPGLAFAGQTPPQIVGTWADPRTYRYQQQIDQVIKTYVTYCTQARATTYYVSTSGNDSNDGLTTGAAFQTIWKVNTVCAASSGNVAFLTVIVPAGWLRQGLPGRGSYE